MMYQLIFTNRFKKDTELLQKRGFDLDILKHVIISLETNGGLDQAFHSHKLSGTYSGYWEAHLKPDWLIIWKLIEDQKQIWLARTGTHSDLFD